MKSIPVSAFFLAVVCCFGASAQSQIPETFRGNWKASWKQPAAGFVKSMEAKLRRFGEKNIGGKLGDTEVVFAPD
jgi:hypothetical protein